LLLVVVVFLLRGPGLKGGGGSLGFRLPAESDTVKTIALAGLELAPELIPRMISHYQLRVPELRVNAENGGTAHALEALANGRAAVGMLLRPPTREEKSIVLSAISDSVLYFPVALGGIEVLAHDGTGPDSLEANDLRRVLRGETHPAFDRLYAPDPNQGLWDAFRSCLGFAVGAPVNDNVTFLENEQSVVEAVRADPRAIGITSSLRMSVLLWY
jgi:ABC-type phosphate transport system substrate-binding protein